MSVMISRSQLQQIHDLIEARTGLAANRQSSDALEDLVLNLSDGDLFTYWQKLSQSRDTDSVWQDLIEALTIGETYFLRDKVHFQLLREEILPQLIRQHRQERKLTIWSVGCATGEEPYSLAITLHELLPNLGDWSIEILGSDLNEKALHIARRGVYRKWAFRHTDLDFQGQYFDPVRDGLQIKPEIQRMVHFRQANLFDRRLLDDCDLILCRNVIIYFGAEHTRRAESILYDSLEPGGWLLLGHAETLQHDRDRWAAGQFAGMPVFQKPHRNSNTASKRLRKRPLSKRRTLTQEVPVIRLPEDGQTQNGNLYTEAVAAIHEEHYSEAEKCAHLLINSNPEHIAAHTLLASIYASRNDFRKAHIHIDAALYLDPLTANAHYLRALLYLEQGRHQEAHKALIAALYCQLHHPLASFLLGNLYAQSGNFKRATHYWHNTLDTISKLDNAGAVSDISPVTVGQLRGIVSEQLAGWD
jgi:chemotaxis protein methyltransferase CheR